MQLFHSPLSNKHSLGCTCLLILPLNAEEEDDFPEVSWVPLAIHRVSSSEFHNSVAAGSEVLWGGLSVWLSNYRHEKDDPHHDRRANLTLRTILETSPWLLKNKNDLSFWLSVVILTSRGWGFFRMAADAVMDTERGRHSRYVSSLKCRKLSEYMLCTQEFAGRRPRALCLCTTIQQRVKLQSPCLSHLTWLDSLDNEDWKGCNCETLVKPGTYHMMK